MSDLTLTRMFIAAKDGTYAAETMVEGAVFKGATQLAKTYGYLPDTPEYKLFAHAYYERIKELYPNGVPLATIDGIPDTIIPE